jgi:hypothetical protein
MLVFGHDNVASITSRQREPPGSGFTVEERVACEAPGGFPVEGPPASVDRRHGSSPMVRRRDVLLGLVSLTCSSYRLPDEFSPSAIRHNAHVALCCCSNTPRMSVATVWQC